MKDIPCTQDLKTVWHITLIHLQERQHYIQQLFVTNHFYVVLMITLWAYDTGALV